MDQRLQPEQLYRRCNAGQLTFETTAELPDLTEIIGQERALEALRFGIDIANLGQHLRPRTAGHR